MRDHPQDIIRRTILESNFIDHEDGTTAERIVLALHGAGWLTLPTWDELHGEEQTRAC